MHDKTAIEMMKRCVEEIKHLRARIDQLEPKAHAYDQLSIVLGLLPKPSRGMCEDVVWKLLKEIDEANARISEEKASGSKVQVQEPQRRDR